MGQAGSTFNAGEDKPSYSAMVQSGIRYLGTLDPDVRVRTNDTLGIKFLEGPYKVFSYSWLRSVAIAAVEAQWPGGYGFSCVRSLIGDKEFSSFTGDQIINLGSGFCTRSVRYAKPGVYIFELDRPATIEKKKRVMASLKGKEATSNTIKFIPVDFQKQTLEDVLLKETNYSSKAVSLFIWEGVSMYISDEAVDRTLQFIKQNSAPGSLLLFDYFDRDYIMSQGKDGKFYGGQTLYNTCKKKREFLTFGIPQGEIGDWLNERGFELVKHWKRGEMEEEFLIGSDGKVAHKADGPIAIALARSV